MGLQLGRLRHPEPRHRQLGRHRRAGTLGHRIDDAGQPHRGRPAARTGAHGAPAEQLRPDLARAGTASQSSTDGAADAAYATDGDTSTDTRTLSEPGAWWQVDLGEARRVGQVEVWNNTAMTTADFDVQLARAADFADATTLHVTGRSLRPTLLDTDAEARYIRIKLTGTGPVALAHVLVHPART
ncbi:discoidin domain-containing protein [Streptomyces sp. NBC_01381]|uniref:discoidin domain-containing protein n=1 Tax=Streptomyces sp. NBC_01381 TaxID=2903845 RepID=UPI002257B5D9|nr:discoidin domain-containing protein [Streptomyces sp. NBC_01381]MCX4671694.1 discoidin domain-containing protein [Streptomyces sp. NBC_01381]